MGSATAGAKGQILSLEVIVAFSFFLAAMLIFLASWNSMFATYYREATMRQMQTSLVGISDMLVMSPGEPADWEFSVLENASSFGLAASRNSLSVQKLSALQSLNSSYDKVRESMGAGASQIYIAVKDGNGGVIYAFGNPYDPLNPDIISTSADRLALLDGTLVKVTVQVWRSK